MNARSLVIAHAAVALIVVGWSAPARAEAPPAGARVHAVIVVDSLDERIGKSVALDADFVEAALRAGFADHQKMLSLTVMSGKDATPEAVLKYYRELKVGADDTVLFYFSGHGGFHRRSGHFLMLGDRALLRSEVLDAIKAAKPRLSICLTDCCANYADEAPEINRGQTYPWETFESLLFGHQGVVDINACSIGEVAWCDRQGSLFTRALLARLEKTPKELGGESDKFVHWDDMFRHVRKETGEHFKKLKAREQGIGPDETQIPQAFRLPGHRFGAVLKSGPDGAVVTRVYRGSPADAALLKPDSVIVKVGDISVKTSEEVTVALEKAKGAVILTVRPAGSKETVACKLRLVD